LRGRLAGGGLADSSATHAPPGRRVESIRESAYLWVAVPTLARGDVERVLRFAGEAESLDGDDPFTKDLLVELGELVQADWITYFERDHLGRHLFEVGRPEEAEAWDGVPVEGWADVTLNGSPLNPHRRNGYLGALRVSDFLSQRELHRTRFYEIGLRPLGVEHTMEIEIPSPPSQWRTFSFDNAERAFSERDRLVLDLVQPHLVRRWQTAMARRELAAALTGVEQAEAPESRGVIVLGARGEVEYASEPARRLLREFAPNESLVEGFESGGRRPLVHHLGERRLIVKRVGDALLLEEKRDAVGLTAREREVLAWVARGKTNPEIARLLWLAPSTVGKHLENVYSKLGVKTRTAAVARFLGPIDVEGGDAESIVSAQS
jgi:DNA-binding CsgD family transcriptional regulator